MVSKYTSDAKDYHDSSYSRYRGQSLVNVDIVRKTFIRLKYSGFDKHRQCAYLIEI